MMGIQSRIQQEFLRDLMWERVKKSMQRTAERSGARFALERDDGPGSVEDVVDTVANYGARLVSLHTSRSSDRVCIYVTAADLNGRAPALRDELGSLGEILYFKSIAQGDL
jgi:hypothetical protein